jgi:hypothetical protein
MLTSRVPCVGANFGEVLVQQMAIPPLAPSLPLSYWTPTWAMFAFWRAGFAHRNRF